MKINEDLEMIVNTLCYSEPIDIEMDKRIWIKSRNMQIRKLKPRFEYNDEYKKMKNYNNNTDKKS